MTLENKTEVGECRKECTTLMHACRFLALRWISLEMMRRLIQDRIGKTSIFDVSKNPKIKTEAMKSCHVSKNESL